jgi:hypothetical protein
MEVAIIGTTNNSCVIGPTGSPLVEAAPASTIEPGVWVPLTSMPVKAEPNSMAPCCEAMAEFQAMSR